MHHTKICRVKPAIGGTCRQEQLKGACDAHHGVIAARLTPSLQCASRGPVVAMIAFILPAGSSHDDVCRAVHIGARLQQCPCCPNPLLHQFGPWEPIKHICIVKSCHCSMFSAFVRSSNNILRLLCENTLLRPGQLMLLPCSDWMRLEQPSSESRIELTQQRLVY
jgi:hypothetical protein